MDWLASLPALLFLVTCPLMVLLMVDAFIRNYTAESARARDPEGSRLILMMRSGLHGQGSDHQTKKAA